MTSERVFGHAKLAAAAQTPSSNTARPRFGLCRGRQVVSNQLHLPDCSLVAAFGEHLAQVRTTTTGPVPGVLRCCAQPLTRQSRRGTAGQTAIAHLVAVRHADKLIHDHVVWEVLDRAVLLDWLPHADDPDRWAGRITELCRLRHWLRHNNPVPPEAPALHELRRLVADRYLSMKFVLQHSRAVSDALTALHTYPWPSSNDQDN